MYCNLSKIISKLSGVLLLIVGRQIHWSIVGAKRCREDLGFNSANTSIMVVDRFYDCSYICWLYFHTEQNTVKITRTDHQQHLLLVLPIYFENNVCETLYLISVCNSERNTSHSHICRYVTISNNFSNINYLIIHTNIAFDYLGLTIYFIELKFLNNRQHNHI